MALEAGTKLGPYEILSPIGAGGMGEVYRARDTRLDRDVAIKVLPSHLTASSEFKQRFDREAKTISQLSHPNICTLHDIGSEDGIDFLVMEFLEGETLGQRLRKGRLALEDVLRFGIEIASALDKAHRADIVHRDLKPGNIMLTKSGAKLLDFGLAKTAPGQSGLSTAPDAVTLTEPLTGKGTIVGTFQYMAPEQLEGKEADQRTDIFAFGAVLYEMATGKRAFEGSSRASLIASIMSSQPRSISEFQPMTPPALERLVKTCLTKDPDDRIQTAHDIKLQLQWIAEGGSQVGAPVTITARRKSRERFWIVSSICLLLATVALAYAYVRLAGHPRQIIHAAILTPQDARFVFTGDGGGPVVLSPDGKHITFSARCADGIKRLWLRTLESSSARVLQGTDEAYFPFWSWDSKSVGYFVDQKLNRIDIAGGFPVTLCDAPEGKGGTWSSDGNILFSPNYVTQIFRVPDTGGTPIQITKFEDEGYTTHRWPIILPDGKHFLYFAGNHDLSLRENDAIFFASIDGTVNKMVVQTSGNAAYASGYLLYLRNNTLIAQAFDSGRGDLTGDPIPIASDVQYDGAVWRGIFSASHNDILVYQTGVAPSGITVTWFDRDGNNLGQLSEQTRNDRIRLSPDGQQVLICIGDPGDIWTFDLQRGVRTRITTEPVDENWAIWSSDGSKIVFTSRNRPDKKKILYMKSSTGMGSAQLLWESNDEIAAMGWSKDNRFLLVVRGDSENQSDIELLLLEGKRKLIQLISSPFNEGTARFSPDDRWIAYSSNESGRYEVYVIPFCSSMDADENLLPCDRTGRWQISTSGGVRPIWSRDGKTLFYQKLDRMIIAVKVDGTGDSFETSTSESLFIPDAAVTTIPSSLISSLIMGYAFDVTPDGQKFLINTFGAGDATPVTLVVNWTKMLKNR